MITFKYPNILFLIIPTVIILFFIIIRNTIKFDDYREQVRFESQRKWKRIFMLFSRTIIFSLLIAALAQPFELKQETIAGNPTLNIYADNSLSFNLFEENLSDKIASEVSKTMPVTTRTLAEGNHSALGDAILSNMQGNDNILLITDGNNNYGRSLGDIMLFASSLNSTISALDIGPIRKDAVVTIEGPSETTADTENVFEVQIRQAGHLLPYMLKVVVDNEMVVNEQVSEPKTIIFSKKLKEGYHKITAEIDPDDHFSENNKFLKAVKVQPKPKILFLSQKSSPSSPIFSSIYDVTSSQTVPQDISAYSAIIINDIKAENLPISKLTDYVLSGNGLFIIGGKSSFEKDNYKTTDYKSYEALMPVVVGTGKEEPKRDVNVVLLIDISGSTGSNFNKGSSNTVKEIEKALAVSILGDIKKTSNVGVIAFESTPHIVSGLQRLSDTPELENKIKSLSYGRGTDITAGLTAAIDMLSSAHGSKNIILISDGITGGSSAEDLRMAEIASSTGAKVFTVGVGENTDKIHMQNIAAEGGGSFFEPKETEKIRIILGESEKTNDSFSLEIVDSYHFITKNIKLSASINGYNYVLPKSQSQMLVTTSGGEPILTTWRFGLGRIAVLSTDDGSSWNGEMLGKQNSALLTRTTNWAIGDLSRNKEFDVQMEDTFIGDELEINVITSLIPKAPNLNFTKTGERLYTAKFKPEESGFYQFFDAVAAVNYNKELSETGINPTLNKLVLSTNGQMFEQNDIEGILVKVKQDTKRMKTQTKSYGWVLAIIALAAFLSEIGIRRYLETKRINNELRG